MKSEEKDRSKQSKAVLIEWQVYEDERDWQRRNARESEDPRPEAQPHPGLPLWALRWGAPFLLLVLVLLFLGGRWIQSRAQVGLDEIESELQSAVAAEPWLPLSATTLQQSSAESDWQAQIVRDARSLHALAEPDELITKIELLDLGKDWALLQVVIRIAGETVAYRQTRTYQQTALGWVRAAPTTEQWGYSHQLESRYFIFHYFTPDAAAVEAAADKLDLLYPALYATFFPEPPDTHKLVVSIDPTLMPGELPQQAQPDDRLIIPSPAATLAPVTLAAHDLLAQSLVLALFGQIAEQATQHYSLPPHWLPLRSGLHLWFIWNHELPLGSWRSPLVQWALGGPTNAGTQAMASVPEFAHNLCKQHHLWMRSPIEIGVPVACLAQGNAEEEIVAWRYPYPPPLEDPLPIYGDVPPLGQDNGQWHSRLRLSPLAAPVALETVVEYAATTYGSERLPVLLAALPRHLSWERLLPAVFGVSITEFEAGWRSYLAKQYNITLSH